MLPNFLCHFPKKIVSSRSNPYRFLRLFLYGVLIITALGQLAKLYIFAGTSEALLNRDLAQDYVMGRALIGGANSRLPFPELAKSILGMEPRSGINPNPCPHAPLMTLLFIPISLLPLQYAQQLWVLISAACGFAAFRVLAGMIKVRNKTGTALLVLSLAILLRPGFSDLYFGQWSFQQILILALFLKSHLEGRFVISAVYLALAMALRPVFLPLCLFVLLSLNNRFRVAFIISAGAITLLLFAALGVDEVLSYPAAAKAAVHLWMGAWHNLSLLSLPANLALPMKGQLFQEVLAPVLPREISANWALVGRFLAMWLGVTSVLRARNREPLQGMLSLLIISPLVSPITWDHYLVVLLIPLFMDGARLFSNSGLKGRLVFFALIAPMVFPAENILLWVVSDTPTSIPIGIQIPLLGRLVYPMLTFMLLVAWGFYPLTKSYPTTAPLRGGLRN